MLILTVSWLWSTVIAVLADALSPKVGGYTLCTPVSLNNFTFTVRSPNDNRINLCAQLVSLHLHPQAEKYFDTS